MPNLLKKVYVVLTALTIDNINATSQPKLSEYSSIGTSQQVIKKLASFYK